MLAFIIRVIPWLVCIGFLGGCPKDKPPSSPVAHALPPGTLAAVEVEGERWISVGTRGRAQKSTVIWMAGDAGGHRTTRVIESHRGHYGRDIAWLGPNRVRVFGEKTVPRTSGVLGHPLYQGFTFDVNLAGTVQTERTFGQPGVTGWRRGLFAQDWWILGGANRGHFVLHTETATGAEVWHLSASTIDRMTDMAFRATEAGGEVGVLGEKGPITRGTTRFLVVGRQGQKMWSWPKREKNDRWTVMAEDGPRGWLIGGARMDRAAVVALNDTGQPRWTWILKTKPDAPSSRVAALAVQQGGGVLVVVVQPLGSKEARYPRMVRLSPEGRPQGTPQMLRPKTAKGAIQVSDAAAFLNGWLVVGGQADAPGKFQPCVWFFNTEATLVWTATADSRSRPL